MVAGTVAAVIVAAGRGLRAGGDLPKQYRALLGTPVVRLSLATFAHHADISIVQPVIHPGDNALYRGAVTGLTLRPAVAGGKTRQASVRAGLEALAGDAPDFVLIHDAARPFASTALISQAIKAAHLTGAAVPVIAPADTVKTIDASGVITGTLDRSRLRMAQTPQAFAFAAVLGAHRKAQVASLDDFGDDAALAEWAGIKVSTFEGEADNVKLTSNEDFARAEGTELARLSDVRTGFGFDVHQFGAGDHVMLGGIRISHSQGLVGHSDADVVLHAVVDALLGALAEGDIGVHFSPTDPQWRGAPSDRFMAFAVDRLRARGGRIAHIDITVVCEAPRIGPHRDAMRARIAAIAGLSIDRVGLKATTSEKMGFTGRGEGMAAFANATIRLPWSG